MPLEIIVNLATASGIANSAVIRKSTIDQVGGFDPFLPGEEKANLSDGCYLKC